MATEQAKKKFSFPSAFTILFILLVLIARATWIIPAGSYDYNPDREPIPETSHRGWALARAHAKGAMRRSC